MAEEDLRELAVAAGLQPDWQGIDGGWHRVSGETLRQVLGSLGIAARSARQISQSRQALSQQEFGTLPALVTATAGSQVTLAGRLGRHAQASIVLDSSGRERLLPLVRAGNGAIFRAPRRPGYHRLRIGRHETVLAVAPPRGTRCADMAGGERAWGISAQVYGLMRRDDAGVGDFSALKAFAQACAEAGAAALAISPLHAQFSADSGHFSPYSPSNRLWLNVLHIDVDAARQMCGLAGSLRRSSLGKKTSSAPFVDWPAVSRSRLSALRILFRQLQESNALASETDLGRDFQAFASAGGAELRHHALFETLQAHFLQQSPALWHWRQWPAAYRNPDSASCRRFSVEHAQEVAYHLFLQWLASRQLRDVSDRCRAGMSIGLISDMAVGSDSGGSQAWADQANMLAGLSIGAPPDDFNADGQNWGITNFSPQGLHLNGYRPFIDLLRASLQYAGGVRMDHILGLRRLWVIPEGAKATDGVYLNYPLKDLLRLTALESHRSKAFILGEDLGTVPDGFRNDLQQAGISGMQVLWFQRHGAGFQQPGAWAANAVGMTTTHDLPTVAGWWRGTDLAWRSRISNNTDPAETRLAQRRRQLDRRQLWQAFQDAGITGAAQPPANSPAAAVDAAIAFLGRTPCELTLLPIEDVLGLQEQPNLPGTIREHPNWRRRLPAVVGNIFRDRLVKRRLRLHQAQRNLAQRYQQQRSKR